MKSIKQTRNLSYVVQVGTGTPGMLEFGMLIVTVVFFYFFQAFIVVVAALQACSAMFEGCSSRI
jgi:hypothetical protein